MKLNKIQDYQLRELEDEILFVNKYDLSLMYLYELNKYWKEFFFDLIIEASNSEDIIWKSSLLDLKRIYKDLIKEYSLNIDIKDYPELNDYISFDEWQEDGNNGVAYFNDGIYLIQK